MNEGNGSGDRNSERGRVGGRVGGREHAVERDRTEIVHAAGCVLWRTSPYAADGTEICLVHRPKYDDWSHPKGKLKRVEDALSGAVREVLEETGYHCAPGARLGTVSYLANGRTKQVVYWAAEATRGSFAVNEEVDRILWLPAPAARDHLTHPRDRFLVDALLNSLPAKGPARS